jgi:hypothetical protein
MATPSYGETEHLVIHRGVRPFDFSGELDPERRHFCEYVPDMRISRRTRRFGAVQRPHSAIQRVGHRIVAWFTRVPPRTEEEAGADTYGCEHLVVVAVVPSLGQTDERRGTAHDRPSPPAATPQRRTLAQR